MNERFYEQHNTIITTSSTLSTGGKAFMQAPVCKGRLSLDYSSTSVTGEPFIGLPISGDILR